MSSFIGGGHGFGTSFDPAFQTKHCHKCNTTKHLSEFPKNRARKDGYNSQCKDCKNANSKRDREARPEHYKIINKKHRDNNLTYYREYGKKWRRENPDKCKQYDSNYITKHPERKKESWRNATAKRRALKFLTQTQEVLYSDILDRDGLWCYLCNSEIYIEDVHFDHVVPLSKGGSHMYENIKVTHSHCNKRKSDKLLSELDWISVGGET
jgi:5-methylcytosine-specific restriction endonuclease McrA